MPKIRKTFIIKGVLADTVFTQNINIPFDIDELRITQVTFTSAAAAPSTEFVVWEGVGEICSFLHNDYFVSCPNSIIDMRYPGKLISGLQTFRLYGSDGNPEIVAGELIITLEAIKY